MTPPAVDTGTATPDAAGELSHERPPFAASATKPHFRYWSPWLLLFSAIWIIALYAIAPDASALIKAHWMFIPIGAAGALLGNISAVGGGIVFIPCIIFIFHLSPLAALKIALATQSFGMTSGAIGWLQKKMVPLRALQVAIPGLLVGSSISSFLIHPSALLVKLLFGPVSILLGVLTLVLAAKRRTSKLRCDIPPRQSDRSSRPPFLADLSQDGSPSVKAKWWPHS